MKRFKMYAMVLAMMLVCLTGCGSEKAKGRDFLEVSRDDQDNTSSKHGCDHKKIDDRGICHDCGKEVGVEIGRGEAEKYFDITLTEVEDMEANWNNTASGYFEFTITPKPEYEDCRFTDVVITLYGTTDDGVTRHTNERLGLGTVDEDGEGYITGYMYNVYKLNGMNAIGNGSGTTPRIHYQSSTGRKTDVSHVSNMMDENSTACPWLDESRMDPPSAIDDPSCEFFHTVNAGLHVEDKKIAFSHEWRADQ